MRALLLILIVLSTLTMAGCELAGNIFQAGIWVGVIVVLVIVSGIALLAAKLRR